MKYKETSLIIIAFLIVILLSNCTRYKKIVYLQDRYHNEASDSIKVSNIEDTDILLLPGDNIYIDIAGTDIKQLYMFDKNAGSQHSTYSDASLYIQGYILDKRGDVELPLIGKVSLSNMTLAQAREKLQSAFNEYLKGIVIDIRLLSYRITMLGEFSKPGTHTFYKRDVNLLDALGEAGDISTYGDRSSVLIIRKINGISTTEELDLTSSDFYSSPYFWLKPNDVVYVKPLRSKVFSVNMGSISLLLTSLTTLIVILTYLEK